MTILILLLVGMIGTSAGHGSEPRSSDVKSRFVINPQPASPQFVNSILELLSRLPFNLYNNYICNVYAGVYSTPYFFGYPYAYYYFSRGRREAYSTYEMYQYSKTVKGTFKILSSYWNHKELKSLYDEVREIATDIMSRGDQQGPTVAETTRRVLKNYLSRNRVSLSVDDVHNAIIKINTTPKRIFRSSVNYYVRSSCSAVRSNSYCNYVRHMTTSGICSTVYFSNLMLNQCCESNATTGVVTTASTTSATTTSTSSSSTTTTTSSGVTTTASTKECGISKLNPAVRVGGRQKASARFLNFLSMMNELRIVGGVPTDKCEYPWVVRLQVDQSICAGSIIDETHVLSAGHCFGSNTKPSGVTVIAGDHNYDIKDTNEVEIPVSKIDIHPQYKDLPDGTVVNDMAILTLSKPMTFNDCIGPICLPNAGDSSKLDNTECTVAGWGTTSFGGSISPILQEVTVPTYSGQKCKDAYNASLPSNTAVQICAGGPGVDSCQGDSGGPLFCPVNGQYVQYGIVSYGDGCGVAGSAAVYTDVSALLDFIKSKTSSRRYDILNSYYPYFMAKKFRG